MAQAGYYIGLMTGTSADGIDGVLLEFNGEQSFSTLATSSQPFDKELALSIHHLCAQDAQMDFAQLAAIDKKVSDYAVNCVFSLLQTADINAEKVKAIGLHGQTLYHNPQLGVSWQFGSPHQLVARTSIAVVADFRQLDIAFDGEGAPLVPLFHQHFYRHPKQNRVLLNLGGIANVSFIPSQQDQACTGFDVGPANTLMDLWIRKHKGEAYDHQGEWAAQGKLHSQLLNRMLTDPYFAKQAPKSTGREYFNLRWLKKHLSQFDEIRAVDVQRTLLELTAITVAEQIRKLGVASDQVFAFGGGAHNTLLIKQLCLHLGSKRLGIIKQLNIDPDYMEASCFAWLAKQRVAGVSLDASAITGSSQAHLFGVIYRA